MRLNVEQFPDILYLMWVLYDAEINCGISSFWDGGFNVWIGDDSNGHRAETNFDKGELWKAYDWLKANAAKAYPDSEFAKLVSAERARYQVDGLNAN